MSAEHASFAATPTAPTTELRLPKSLEESLPQGVCMSVCVNASVYHTSEDLTPLLMRGRRVWSHNQRAASWLVTFFAGHSVWLLLATELCHGPV